MSGIRSKITRYAKKENVIYNEKKNQSIENNPQMTQLTGLADKDIKTALDNIFHTFKTLRKKQNILNKDMIYIRNTQTEILEMTATALRLKINQMEIKSDWT